MKQQKKNKVMALNTEKQASGISSLKNQLFEEMEKGEQLKKALFELEARYNAFFVQAPDSIVLIDAQTGELREFNERAHNNLGYTREEFQRMKISDFEILESPEEVEQHIKNIVKEGYHTFKTKHRKKNGEVMDIMVSARAVTIGSRDFVQAIWKDITDLKKAEAHLKHQALYDQLTDLPNRTLFAKRLKRVANRTGRHMNYKFAILFMDLDRFKIINDSLGHFVGDQLLVEVAQRLQACVRSTDTVARFGGDEFAILLDEIKETDEASITADRIQQSLSLPFDLSGHKVYTTASIGIALSTTGYEIVDDMLRNADSAMYRAKSMGRARSETYESKAFAYAKELLFLETDLWRAVEQMEFQIYYQPIFSLTENRITGMESFIRWQHPQIGLIPSEKFIPLAEETGLISAIGEWMLRTGCAQIKTWQHTENKNLHLNINISLRQFHYQDILEMIKKVLEETGLSAQSLNIEITENIVIEKKNFKVLSELSALGVQISIDNFGSGYYPLSSLKSFPISALKIDKNFVKDIGKDPNIETIIAAIIAMAHSLKINVIAKGVESPEQLEFLRNNHCDFAQGYLFSPSVSADSFTELLKKVW